MKIKITVLLLCLSAVLSKAQSADQSGGCVVFIPYMFEPNVESGKIIEIESKGVMRFEMKIYNCWGVKVIESDTIAEIKSGLQSVNKKKIQLKSDGNDDVVLNQQLFQGNYSYTIDVTCLDGGRFQKEGDLQLLRTEHR